MTLLAPLLSPIFNAHLKVSHHKSVMGKFFRMIAMVGDGKTAIKVSQSSGRHFPNSDINMAAASDYSFQTKHFIFHLSLNSRGQC